MEDHTKDIIQCPKCLYKDTNSHYYPCVECFHCRPRSFVCKFKTDDLTPNPKGN